MISSNKHKRTEKVPQDVPIRTWLRILQEAVYLLGNIETKTTMTPRVKSQSVLKSKLEGIKIRAHPNNTKIEEIIADIPKGEQN